MNTSMMVRSAAEHPVEDEVLTLEGRLKIAEILHQAKIFPDIANMAQAFARIQAGHEMGLGPMTSLREISILPGGRPVLSAHIQAAMIQRSGKYRYTVDYCDQTGCKLTFWGREMPGRGAWEVLGSTEFTLEMAHKAMIYEKERGSERATQKPLADKWNYKSWAEDMFFARAMTRGHRYCAEVFGGMVALPTDLQEEASPEAQKDGATHVRDLWGDPAPARTALMVEAPVTPQDAPEAVVVPERPLPQPRPAVAPGPCRTIGRPRAPTFSGPGSRRGGPYATNRAGCATASARPRRFAI